jgi:type VI protein secretion system component Hcp
MNELTPNELDQVSGGKGTFDIEQTLNIGSQSTGAGAGKVTFNPFSITRKVDRASPVFFAMF